MWHCQCHIRWTPKYRYLVIGGEGADDVNTCIAVFSEQQKCEIVALNVRIDHVHVLPNGSPEDSNFRLWWHYQRQNRNTGVT